VSSCPTFLGIGELKAATTTLFFYLRQHPDIFLPEQKELRFFAFDANNPSHKTKKKSVFPVTTWEDYLSYFSSAIGYQAIGEISPNYLHSVTAAQRIREFLPNVKLVAIIRNPVDRLISEYEMAVRLGNENRSITSFIKEGIKNHEWMIESSFPGKNLQRFYDKFDASQIKVLLFDEFIRDPLNCVREVCEFIGVDPEYHFAFVGNMSKGGIPTSKGVAKIYQLIKSYRTYFRPVARYVPSSAKSFIRSALSKNMKKTHVSPNLRRDLVAMYMDDLCHVEKLIGRDLSSWKQL